MCKLFRNVVELPKVLPTLVLWCFSECCWLLSSSGSTMCQCAVNKTERLEWARENKDMSFDDVIYTDETTVQIETHRRTCCYRKGQKPRYKPKPKHPVKVHVWAGISCRGRTKSVHFRGKDERAFLHLHFAQIGPTLHQGCLSRRASLHLR